MTTSADVRRQLIDALRLDLVGPEPHDEAHAGEVLPQAPSKWYVTGFLAPATAPADSRSDELGDDELDEVNGEGRDDEDVPERAAARRRFFPSSLGLSVLVPAGTAELHAIVDWGDYLHEVAPKSGVRSDEALPDEAQQDGEPSDGDLVWRRKARHAEVAVPVAAGGTREVLVDGTERDGLFLVSIGRTVTAQGGVPAGTVSASLFLVNRRRAALSVVRDESYVFQACLSVTAASPFVARPDASRRDGDDWDDRVADLQYRDTSEVVVGHNVSATAIVDGEGRCRQVRTVWIPEADVLKVEPGAMEGVELSMEVLGEAASVEVRDLLKGLPEAYRSWIAAERLRLPADRAHREVGEALLHRAETVARRIEDGLVALEQPDLLLAFQVANRAMAAAARQRRAHTEDGSGDPTSGPAPRWRPFQLAFLLMNVNGVAEPLHPERGIVDLLFFPTGGGKTEAYLGVAAFTLVLRRLRNPGLASAGVSVLMRYTLRLLTLDQLSRASTLVCALELERQREPERLGPWPFEVGLWVGQAATPNRMGKKGDHDEHTARAKTLAFERNSKDKRNSSPIPLENCPWCGRKFEPHSFRLLPDADAPEDLRVLCLNRRCAFQASNPLPVVAVDEPIYRRLPAFLIATVDKFASLPWVGHTGALFGKVERHDARGFYGPCDPGRGRPLDGQLPPPDLVIQDELHLISGPLGTLVGLYETAIDHLCTRTTGERAVGPKIVASTATVRRADRQIRALFGRSEVEVFPPPGPDRNDSFFARTVPAAEKNPRTYVGLSAPGRSQKVVLLRAYLALAGAAQKAWEAAGGPKSPDNPADPYMTLLGYFNSLRELGGSRRIVEDEVTSRLLLLEQRKRLEEAEGLFSNRQLTVPTELTSRVSTGAVADTKRRLALAFNEKERVDVALATNMISVGLDITRLGLMVVFGQPKTASEYIQATSRVGRDDRRPGLVVTLFNIHRPRDRSHYERFEAWHATFYRAVEVTSVTPFSPRALDRALAAVTVALARLGHPGMTAPPRALDVLHRRRELDQVADVIARRAEGHDGVMSAAALEALRVEVRGRVMKLLDVWEHLAVDHNAVGAGLQYQREKGGQPGLLHDPLDPDLDRLPEDASWFRAHRSLRDVEPSVNLLPAVARERGAA